MATLQVKGIDDGLYEDLRRRSARNHRSISQEVVTLVEASLTRPCDEVGGNATDAFLELAGRWDDERTAEEIADSIRTARRFGTRTVEGLF